MRSLSMILLVAVVWGCGGGPTPPPLVPAALSVAPTSVIMTPKQTTEMSSVIRDQYGQPMDVPLVWNSADPAVAKVTYDGTVTAMSVGQTVVWTSVKDMLEAVPVLVVEPMTVTVRRDTLTLEPEERGVCAYRIVAVAEGGVPGDSAVWAPSSVEYLSEARTVATIELTEVDMLDRFGALVMRSGDTLRTHRLRAEPGEAGATLVNRFRYTLGPEMRSARVPIDCPPAAPQSAPSR